MFLTYFECLLLYLHWWSVYTVQAIFTAALALRSRGLVIGSREKEREEKEREEKEEKEEEKEEEEKENGGS